MTIVQQNTGLRTDAAANPFTVTLPGTTVTGNRVILVVAGNTTVTTPAGFTLRASQVAQMGHYLFDGPPGAASWSVTAAAGQLTWWVAEVVGGTFDIAAGANSGTVLGTTYATPALVPTAGTRLLLASIGSLTTSGGAARTISGWTNSYTEQADICQPTADAPMQGIAVIDNTTRDGVANTSTGGTFTLTSKSSALIASYVTSVAVAGVLLPRRPMVVGQAVNRAATF